MESDENSGGAMVLVERQADVVTITLNRPNQFNALSEELLGALANALNHVRTDTSVRCVILGAAGKAFCAGHDLREMRSKPSLDYYRALFTKCCGVMQSIQSLDVPVIARVHGLATAAGCQLVASCDLAFAAQSARFAVSGINVGLFCSTPAVALSRNVSRKRAFEMLVTGRFVDASVAAESGLVNAVVPDESLDSVIAGKVCEIVSKSPAAIRHGKYMFYRQLEMPLTEAYAFAGEVMAQNMMEDDASEGINAFLEKRLPTWGAH
ncbi:enoyl-CoA hydratase [Paraburkholderia ginsengiterrae]|uniref:Enoyl-CoA hydratase domain-containing protein 3, mitochondrial n=1 Tax=Paraburkholderia ginsengiterrae TaxID=1462993 RepID=A0A1A9N4B5_9BURK|nr:enoyl-CoA hydratase [Paraburkholderia ginsengiterrae]OAJ55986.1 enoyl-CoA hydratase [Paraburkholderia ginsengiterrae]OAJ58556.1 enoyl-CoA hydratase [Paraburkholderia ginsengiterrae]